MPVNFELQNTSNDADARDPVAPDDDRTTGTLSPAILVIIGSVGAGVLLVGVVAYYSRQWWQSSTGTVASAVRQRIAGASRSRGQRYTTLDTIDLDGDFDEDDDDDDVVFSVNGRAQAQAVMAGGAGRGVNALGMLDPSDDEDGI